jgi:hypothetical protein
LKSQPTNYQDLLVFDALTGALSLHRLVAEARPRDGGYGLSVTSITSVTPPTSSLAHADPLRPNIVSPSTEDPDNRVLSGRSNVVASWTLRRRKSWTEVRAELGNERHIAKAQAKRGQPSARLVRPF